MKVEMLKNIDINEDNKNILKNLSLKINLEENFFINDKDLIFVGFNDKNQIVSAIKLSYLDNNLNNLYLNNYDEEKEDEDMETTSYNKFLIVGISAIEEKYEFLLVLNLHKVVSNSEFYFDE